jgi:hypothetical protein
MAPGADDGRAWPEAGAERLVRRPFGEEALRSLCDGARSGQFDPDVARVFLELRLATTDQLR